MNVCPACRVEGAHLHLSGQDWFHARTKRYDLLRCDGCGFVWLANPPNPEEMHEHYGSAYHESVSTGGEKDASRRWSGHRRTLEKYKSGGSILDVGCSSGSFLNSLDKCRWHLYGIEIAPEVAARAEKLAAATVFAGDVLAAKYPVGSFDAITCFHFLEHVYEPRAVVAKFFEWLKPNGVLYIAVPNIESWEARIFGRYWFGLELPRHLSQFSKASLQLIASSVGFETERMRTPPSCYIEGSIHHFRVAIAEKCGKPIFPMDLAMKPSLPFRILRKGFRVTVLQALRYPPAWAGRASEINAVFRKPSVVLQ